MVATPRERKYIVKIEVLARRMAIVESGNNPDAMGDDGRARGRWQLHPPWFAQWYQPELGDTWDQADARALYRYLVDRHHRSASVFEALALFHLGHAPRSHSDYVSAVGYATGYGFSTGELDSPVECGSVQFEDFYGYVSAA